jgi:hypothetical protein
VYKWLLLPLFCFGVTSANAQPEEACALLGSLGQFGYADNTAVEGDLVVIGTVDEGLIFTEIDEEFTPRLIGQWTEFLTSVRDIVLAGSMAFVAIYNDGLLILDIDDPTTPEELSRLDTDGLVWRLAVSGTMVYISQRGSPDNLLIVDASDPRVPVLVGNLSLGIVVETLAVQGDYVFLACYGESLLRIIDVSDPAHPVEVGNYTTQGTPRELVVANNLVYISDGSSSPGDFGLRIFDVSDPTNPLQIAAYADPAIDEFAIYGTLLFAPDSLWLDVFDISVPVSRTYVGRFYHEGIVGLSANDTVVYAANGNNGLAVIGCENSIDVMSPGSTSPDAFALLSTAPNPFNPTTAIHYSIDRAREVRLSVFDVGGRLIRVLADGTQSAGEHCLVFDGMDLTSGMYFVTLEGAGQRDVKKIILLK